MKTPPITITPFTKPFSGNISVPGSKSLTNRIFPLAVLSGEKIVMDGALESEDAEIMREALKTMGSKISQGDTKNSWEISAGNFFEDENSYEIHCGNSGTTIRFLTALCALRKGSTVLTGIERMKERPLGDLVDGLEQMGIKIEFLEEKNFPPIQITPQNFLQNAREKCGKISLSGKLSSQFFTALFHIAPKIGLEISVQGELVSKPYIDMTLNLMSQFGITIENQNYKKFIIPQQNFTSPQKILVEGDASSASYPLAISSITGGKCEIENLPKNSLQGDSLFRKLVILPLTQREKKSENNRKFKIQNSKLLKPLGEINLEDIPDVAMTAVVLCAYADGYSKITGLSTLRHKECDRIFALESNLKKMGAKISSGPDYIEIWGNPSDLHGAEIECFNDHRVAMCFAVLGTVIEGVKILDPDCTKKTYPTFWEDLEIWRR